MTMPEIQPVAPEPDRRRLQFSLASLLVFVTGICITFSFVRWHSTYGLMAAILIVGSGWSFASMRAGYHRLAYTLATPAMGVAGHLALIGPMAVGANQSVWDMWLNPGAILLMSASTVLTAALLRRSILAPGPRVSIGRAIGGIYMTAAIFPLIWGAAATIMEPGFGVLIGVVGLFLSPFFASLTLPFSLPLAIACCWILRKLGPWRPEKYGPITLDLQKTGASRGSVVN